jgi:hypothetical protein
MRNLEGERRERLRKYAPLGLKTIPDGIDPRKDARAATALHSSATDARGPAMRQTRGIAGPRPVFRRHPSSVQSCSTGLGGNGPRAS